MFKTILNKIKWCQEKSFANAWNIIKQELRCLGCSRDYKEISIQEFHKIYEEIQQGCKVPADYDKNIKYEITGDIGRTTRYAKEINIRHNKITCKNLLIKFEKHNHNKEINLCYTITFNKDSTYSYSIINTSVYFEQVIFLAKPKENLADSANLSQMLSWSLEKDAYTELHFTNCFFSGISTTITQVIWPKSSTEYSNSYIHEYYIQPLMADKKLNICFKNTVAISGKNKQVGYHLITKVHENCSAGDHRFIGNIHIENCYLSFTETTATRVKLDLIGNNIIKGFSWDNKEIKFGGGQIQKNSIKTVQRAGLLPGDIYGAGLPERSWIGTTIYWGPYQKIMPARNNYWPRHKDWQKQKLCLMELKKLAKDRQDHEQINILNREITICNHNILKGEPFSSSWQDRITLGFNKWVSNYGISWLRPLFWLITLNVLLTLLILACLSYPAGKSIIWSTEIFFNMFKPLLSLADNLRMSADTKAYDYNLDLIGGLISFINFVQKIGLAILTYEIIRAGRRFTRQYEK